MQGVTQGKWEYKPLPDLLGQAPSKTPRFQEVQTLLPVTSLTFAPGAKGSAGSLLAVGMGDDNQGKILLISIESIESKVNDNQQTTYSYNHRAIRSCKQHVNHLCWSSRVSAAGPSYPGQPADAPW